MTTNLTPEAKKEAVLEAVWMSVESKAENMGLQDLLIALRDHPETFDFCIDASGAIWKKRGRSLKNGSYNLSKNLHEQHSSLFEFLYPFLCSE